jgi:hypothetical protein
MSRNTRLALAGLSVVVLVVAFVIARSGSSSDNGSASSGRTTTTATAQRVARIDIVGGKPKGGIQPITYKKGDTIRLQIHSDTADEIHIHGYDLHKDVAKAGIVSFTFPASIEGVFVIELEQHKQQIASLKVTP